MIYVKIYGRIILLADYRLYIYYKAKQKGIHGSRKDFGMENQTGIKKIVLEEIRNLAKKHHIKKVILFGSRARGDYHRASDIDLAVCGGNIPLFALDVDDDTSTPLKYDVVNLEQHVDEKLLNSIKTEGLILYEEI